MIGVGMAVSGYRASYLPCVCLQWVELSNIAKGETSGC
jgi:hypothetical protein